jgi:hypothetical protein
MIDQALPEKKNAIRSANHDNIESVSHTTSTQLEIWSDCMIGSNDANKAYNLSSLTLKENLLLKHLNML